MEASHGPVLFGCSSHSGPRKSRALCDYMKHGQ